MAKCLTRYQKRHSERNWRTAGLRAGAAAFNKNQNTVNVILRRDFSTGEQKVQSVTDFRFGLLLETGFERIELVAPYSTNEQIAREALERGARLFTDKAEYWIEKQPVLSAKRAFAAAGNFFSKS